MKYLRLLVVVVILLAGGYGLWQFAGPGPGDAAEKPAEGKGAPAAAPEAAVKPATIAPPKVAAPVVAPTKAAPALAVAAVQPEVAASSKFDLKHPQPQADLNDCLEQSLLLLQAKDVPGLVRTLMPPQALQRMIQNGRVASMDDAVVMYSSIPDIQQQILQLQGAMETAKGETPELSEDGTQATYKVDSVPSGPAAGGTLGFVKVDGYWYLR